LKWMVLCVSEQSLLQMENKQRIHGQMDELVWMDIFTKTLLYLLDIG
jgi:hypothetical protein